METITDDALLEAYGAGRRDFREVRVTGTIGGPANLRLTEIPCCDFTEADLLGVQFQGAVLHDCVFDGAELTGPNFNGAQLDRVRFHEAWAERASFCWARLHGADLRGYFGFSAFTSEASLTEPVYVTNAPDEIPRWRRTSIPAFDDACIWPERPVAFACATLDEAPFWETVRFYDELVASGIELDAPLFQDLARADREHNAVTLGRVRDITVER